MPDLSLITLLLKKLIQDKTLIQILSSIGLWNHPEQKIVFNLCVDDFGVKYSNKEDVQHFITTLNKKYIVNPD